MYRILAAIVCIFMLSAGIRADGGIFFPLPIPTPLSVKFHKVTVAIDNGVAQTRIDQAFINTSGRALTEGKYVFPVPAGASVNKFGVSIDGVVYPATVMSREQAQAFFQEEVKTSNQASLLQYTGNGAYSLNLSAIASGETRRVQITYEEVLGKENGLTRYLYPLNTEKFSYSLIDTVSISVSIRNQSPITSVYSPTHMIAVSRVDKYNARADFLSVNSRPNTDFELFYKVSDDEISFHLFTYKEKDADGYFLMLMTPQYIDKSAAPIAKDIAFTIDRSGSMMGDKVLQAKQALTFCLNRLNPADYFNIVSFSETVTSNSPEFLTATAANIQGAVSYVQLIQAGGNTDIAQALTTSLGAIKGSVKPHYVIFLTDGQPTAGQTNPDSIVAIVGRANSNEAKIFSVGFGYDVNTVLIDRLSNGSGGYAVYCDPAGSVQDAVANLYKMIETPLLIKPQMTIRGIETFGIVPENLPDLFAGTEIAIYGRYKNEAAAFVSLSGTVSGSPKTLTYPAYYPSEHTDYPFVPRLWASQRIAVMLAKIKSGVLTTAQESAAIDTLIAMSVGYGIVTPYTSQIFAPQTPVTGGGTWSGNLQLPSGKSANDASNYLQAVRYTGNAAQTVVADTAVVSFAIAPQVNQLQNAGNKVFVFTSDSMWVDAAFNPAAPSDTVFFGTPRYFGLADSLPDLVQYLTVGSRAAINYKGKNYLVLNANPVSAIRPGKAPAAEARSGSFSASSKGNAMVFALPSHDRAGAVTVYSVSGRMITRIAVTIASTTVCWDRGSVLPSGIYYAVFNNEKGNQTLRFSVAK
jgi:Ca-activated chloride channel family protein